MSNQEFNNEFDILYNNIMSSSAPGLDEYEKSVFLTKALDEIVKSYFSNIYNKALEGFDSNERRQYDFSSLIRVSTLFNINSASVNRISVLEKLDKRSEVYLFPIDYFLSVNELLMDNYTLYSVIPLEYTEYRRLMMKPYSYPVKKGAWRLITDKKNCNYYQEYIANTECDYNFLSTWADQKRTLKITIRWIEEDAILPKNMNLSDTPEFYSNTLYWKDSNSNSLTPYCSLKVDSSWDTNNSVYEIIIILYALNASDDSDVLDYIKTGMLLYLNNIGLDTYNNDMSKTIKRTDAFIQSSAPGHFTNFRYTPAIPRGSILAEKAATYYTTVLEYNLAKNLLLTEEDFQSLDAKAKEKTPYVAPIPSSLIPATGGKTFNTSAIEVPFAEIIGNFKSTPIYQIRYIKKLRPIILTDLEGTLSIGGKQRASSCMLPSELHHEVLLRAVELAKAAYIGDLNSTILVGNSSATEKGIVAQ